MNESLDSQFFRTTTGIQSGLDAFDKSRSVMNFVVTLVINFELTEKLCSFRLVFKGKTGNEIPKSSRFEFLQSF